MKSSQNTGTERLNTHNLFNPVSGFEGKSTKSENKKNKKKTK